jgi:predicted unusual protein kinase regulating ubiquinone biosynthesis (AarF/ABC1/UbiB family)
VDPAATAALLIHALSRQVLGEGFFHADPHPGNLLVAPGPDGPILTLLDFGMVGQLTPRHKHAFKRLSLGLLQKDPDMMVAAFDEVDMLRPTADRAALRRALAWLMEKQMQGNLFDLRPAVFLEIARELRQIIASQAFQFPADIAFLGRGTSTTFGVCRALDPEGDFIRQLEGAVRAHIDPRTETTQALAEVAADLARLPARLDRVLTVIEKGGSPAGGLAPGESPRPGLRWGAGAAVAFLGGNQWWAMGYTGMAIACWAAAVFAAVVWTWRRLPPSPAEP